MKSLATKEFFILPALCHLKIFIPLYLYVHVCACMSLCTSCARRCLGRPESIGAHATGVTGTWESSDMGTGNWTLTLWKSSKCCYLLSHVSSPLFVALKIILLLSSEKLISIPIPSLHNIFCAFSEFSPQEYMCTMGTCPFKKEAYYVAMQLAILIF